MRVRTSLYIAIVCIGMTSLSRAADSLPADTDFVRKAENSSNQEIADARVALAKSKAPAILELAKQMEEDGAAVNQRLATLAVEKGWPVPTLDPPEEMPRYSDHGYVVREIRADQRALLFYAEEAANGADTALQELARDTVSTLRQRLVTLRGLRTS